MTEREARYDDGADAEPRTEVVPGALASSGAAERWDAGRIRALRQRLGDSQGQFADRLGTRQQTVSEWERGASAPRRMAQRLLHLVAEAHGVYEVSSGDAAAPGAPEFEA